MLTFNGNNPSTILYNGNEVNTLIYNNIIVWSKKTDSDLPSTYTKLSYIESDGAQYINTGILVNTIAEMYIDMKVTSTYQSAYFGVYVSGDKNVQFGLLPISSTSCWASMDMGFANAVTKTKLDIAEFHQLYCADKSQIVDGEQIDTVSTGGYDSNKNPFILFARHDGTKVTNLANAQVKSFWLKDKDGNYLCNYIPCKHEKDNIVGMYDTVTDKFLMSYGISDFIAGDGA